MSVSIEITTLAPFTKRIALGAALADRASSFAPEAERYWDLLVDRDWVPGAELCARLQVWFDHLPQATRHLMATMLTEES